MEDPLHLPHRVHRPMAAPT
jgi:hypothetical protein